MSVGGGSLPAVRVELDPRRRSSTASAWLDDAPQRHRRRQRQPARARVEDAATATGRSAPTTRRRLPPVPPLIVRYRNGARGAPVGDVAEVVDSVQDVRNYGVANGVPACCSSSSVSPAPTSSRRSTACGRCCRPARDHSAGHRPDVVDGPHPTIRASLREVERARWRSRWAGDPGGVPVPAQRARAR